MLSPAPGDPVLRMLDHAARSVAPRDAVSGAPLPGHADVDPDQADLVPALTALARGDSPAARLLRAALRAPADLAHTDALLASAASEESTFAIWLAEIAARLADRGRPANVADSLSQRDNERIGRYRLLERVGAGASSIVFRAATEDGRIVAIKVLRPEAAAGPTRMRFRAELELLRGLDHPGTARVLDHGTTDWQGLPLPFLVLEFVDGIAITEHADRQRLDPHARLELLVQAARVVDAAHRYGVVHRDITPNNVLVDSHGRVRVVDFGIALARDANNRLERTRTGEFVGTLPYASPEQVGGCAGVCDARSDVYALGVLLHELLEGTAPFLVGPPDLATLLDRIAHHPLPRLSAPRPHRRALQAVIDQATAKDPSERYPSAAELARDIERVRAGARPHAALRSAWTDLTRYIRRYRRTAAAVVLVGTLAVAATITVVVAWRDAVAARRVSTDIANRSLRLVATSLNTIRQHIDPSLTAAALVPITSELHSMTSVLLSHADEPERIDAIASALEAHADTLLHLGDRRAELPLRDEQLGLRQRAVALATSDDREARLAIALVRRADLQAPGKGRMAAYRQALAVDTALFVRSGRSLLRIDNLIWSHVRLALQHADSDPTRALAELAPAQALAEEAVRRAPLDPRALRTLGGVLTYQAGLFRVVDQWALAVARGERACRILQQASGAAPDQIEILGELHVAMLTLGRALRKTQDQLSAAWVLERTAALGERILGLDSSRPEDLYQQGRTLNELLYICQGAGDPIAARALLVAIDAHGRALLDMAPGVARYVEFAASAARDLDGVGRGEPCAASWRDALGR